MQQSSFGQVLSELRDALDAPNATSAVGAVLSALADGGASWLQDAASELRRAIVRARLSDANALGCIEAAADASPSRSGVPAAHGWDYLSPILDAVRSLTVAGDAKQTLTQLLPLVSALGDNASLRWSTWIWAAAAAADIGDLPTARTAADSALTIAKNLDDYALATSLATRVGIAYLLGDIGGARVRLQRAAALFEQAGFPRERSRLWLFVGHWLIGRGEEREGLRALNEAVDSDPDWAVPAIALARRAVVAGRVREAEDILEPLREAEICPAEIKREARFVSEIQQGRLPLSLAADYLWIRDSPLSARAVAALMNIAEEQRKQAVLLECLAWDLALEGWNEAAIRVFHLIKDERQIDAETRASVDEGVLLLQRDRVEREGVNGPLDFIQHALDRIGAREEVSAGREVAALPEGEVFWARRAIMSGNLDDADDILCFAADDAELDEQLQRESCFVADIQAGRIPISVASEYLWLRERPMTDEQLVQLALFAEEYQGIASLRELIAWDFLRDGRADLAATHFDALLKQPKLEADKKRSLEHGQQLAASAPPMREASGQLPVINENTQIRSSSLAHYVSARQQWPTMLDGKSLLFVGSQDLLSDNVLTHAERITVARGQQVHGQGQLGHLFYCMIAGTAVASRMRGSHAHLADIGEGSFFGELGTMYGLPNTASVTATDRASIFVVTRRGLQQQMQSSRAEQGAEVLGAIREMYLQAAFNMAALGADPSLAQTIRQQSQEQGWQTFQRGECIVEQGAASTLWLIVSGLARLFIRGDQHLAPIGYLCPGDLIGELNPSPLTVCAHDTITLAPIDRTIADELAADPDSPFSARVEACREAALALRQSTE